MAICLSGTDSHRSSAGAIQLHHGSNNEKNRWESPIATTFSAFQTSSISTKADCQRRPRVREFIKHSLDAQTRCNGCSFLPGSRRLPIRCPDHIESDPKSAGTIACRLEVD